MEAQLVELWRDVAEAAQAKGGAQVSHHRAGAEPGRACAAPTRPPTHMSSRSSASRAATLPALSSPPPTLPRPICPCRRGYPSTASSPRRVGARSAREQVTVAAGGEFGAAHVRRDHPAPPARPARLPLVARRAIPFDEYLFRNLADSLNRLIVDSAHFREPRRHDRQDVHPASRASGPRSP